MSASKATRQSPRPRREAAEAKAQKARAAKVALKGREKHRVAATEIAERQRVVGRMHLERIPQWEIAEKLSLTETIVSRDLKVIRAAWRAEAISDVGEATERELKALEASEKRLRASWDRVLAAKGMKPALRALAECKINAELARIAGLRAKLLGLEAPTKLVHTGPDGQPIQHDVTARGPDAATLEEERALRALPPEARRAVLERARAEILGAGGMGAAVMAVALPEPSEAAPASALTPSDAGPAGPTPTPAAP